jgi:hypothetical protein
MRSKDSVQRHLAVVFLTKILRAGRDIWRPFSSLKYCSQVLVRYGQPGEVAGELHLLHCGAARPPLPLHLHLRSPRSATVPLTIVVMLTTRTKSKLAMKCKFSFVR